MRNYLLVIVAVAATVAATVAASSASALTKPAVFTLVEVEGPQKPLGEFDFSRAPVGGDRIIATNELYATAPKGLHVGHDRVLFTFMTGFGDRFSHKAVVLFQAQVYLPNGTIFVEGYGSLPADDSPVKLVLPVVGGTRNYSNARGYVVVHGARRTLLTFHLTP